MQLNVRDERARRGIVYLVPWYPGVSPTFVLREVQALRSLGRPVSTMSIHRPPPEDVLAEADREAYATTYFLSPPRFRDHLAAHWQALRTRPRAYVATLAAALRAGPMEPAVKAHGLLYFCEAVVAWWHARRCGSSHVHGVFAGPAADAAMLVARLGGEEWSWSLAAHGTDMLQIPPARLAAKVRSARFVTVSSDFGRSQLMILVGQEHWPKIRVVHCGLDLVEYDGPPATSRSDELQLINVGRLEREKGHALMLDALAAVRERRVSLTVIGHGSELESLRAQARRLGIADRVHFLGRVGQDEIRHHYARADAFCLSSLGEGIPVVLMEAMALRMPVIAPRLMGIPELVQDGTSGLLFSPGRADALAAAIEALASQRERWGQMGEAGRARVADEFEIQACAATLEDVLAQWVDRVTLAPPADADLRPDRIASRTGRGPQADKARAGDS